MGSEREKFAQRLNESLDDAGLPKIGQGRQSALAKLLDVTPQQAGKWIKGEDFPQTSKLVKLAQFLGVRSNWLLSGAGERYLPEGGCEPVRDVGSAEIQLESPAASGADYAAMGKLLSQEAFDVALSWMKLPPGQRDPLRRLIHELARDL
jgi:transcriptional regulator with XRE-family HTH domain